MYGTEAAAKAVGGFCLSVMDRAQGAVNYSRLGAYVLGAEGLAKSLFVVCSADSETDWSGLSLLRGCAKVILIANDGQAMKRAKITVEQIRLPTVAEMTRTLFCDHGMDVTKAQRLARLSGGDWRALKTLEAYFAQIDIARLNDGDFELAVASAAKDKPRAESMHPSFAAFLLRSGQAKKHCGRVENLADYGVLAWGERNLGVTSETIDEMARLQEAACIADAFVAGGAGEFGLEHWVRSAALKPKTGLCYNYQAYSVPERSDGKETPEAKALRESWKRRAPWAKRKKSRLASTQEADDKPAKRGRKREATTGPTKSAPRRRNAPSVAAKVS